MKAGKLQKTCAKKVKVLITVNFMHIVSMLGHCRSTSGNDMRQIEY